MTLNELPRYRRKLTAEYKCWQNPGTKEPCKEMQRYLNSRGVGCVADYSSYAFNGWILDFGIGKHQINPVGEGDWLTIRERKDGTLSVITYRDAEFKKRYEAI